MTVMNLSITGLLVELDQKKGGEEDIEDIFNSLRASTLVDIFIPSMRLAGETEVIRADQRKDKILIALEFKSISYDVEDFIYKRKVYRKRVAGIGRMWLNDAYHDFTAVNASVDGLMIRLNERVAIEKTGATAAFEFEKLGLTGEAEIIWCEHSLENETLIGLRYVHLEQGEPHGLPIFANR
ncbi:MAG: PilZ domain-containing protein [Gammaproteobacteria bacterium]